MGLDNSPRNSGVSLKSQKGARYPALNTCIITMQIITVQIITVQIITVRIITVRIVTVRIITVRISQCDYHSANYHSANITVQIVTVQIISSEPTQTPIGPISILLYSLFWSKTGLILAAGLEWQKFVFFPCVPCVSASYSQAFPVPLP